MRITGNWRPNNFLEPLIGSYVRLANTTLLVVDGKKFLLPYVPLESGRNVFAQPPTLTCEIVSAEGL